MLRFAHGAVKSDGFLAQAWTVLDHVIDLSHHVAMAIFP